VERPDQPDDGGEMEGGGKEGDHWGGVEEDLQNHGQVKEQVDHGDEVKEDLQDHGQVKEQEDRSEVIEEDIHHHGQVKDQEDRSGGQKEDVQDRGQECEQKITIKERGKISWIMDRYIRDHRRRVEEDLHGSGQRLEQEDYRRRTGGKSSGRIKLDEEETIMVHWRRISIIMDRYMSKNSQCRS
jgi:hypothetical protein